MDGTASLLEFIKKGRLGSLALGLSLREMTALLGDCPDRPPHEESPGVRVYFLGCLIVHVIEAGGTSNVNNLDIMVGWDDFPSINEQLALDLGDVPRDAWQSMTIDQFRALVADLNLEWSVGEPVEGPTHTWRLLYAGNSCWATFDVDADGETRLLQVGISHDTA